MRSVFLVAVGWWLASPPTAAQAAPAADIDQATVWYLRHAGWAVRLGDVLLVFDYQESRQMEGVTDDTPRALDTGFVDPREIADLDVYVFVSHAHGDHLDSVIFTWRDVVGRLTYVIGWEERPESHCERLVGPPGRCFTMAGPRATAETGAVRVYTIDSHHNGIPEVAYLVQVGDWVVYHNGDYMADYEADYAYFATVSPRIDLAFVAGIPTHRWPHLARAVHLAREFDVPVLFPGHFPDDAACEAFAADVAAEGVDADVRCPRVRGQRFVVRKEPEGR